MFDLPAFISDLISNQYVSLLLKYENKIPYSLNVSVFMDFIKKNNLFEKFVDIESQVKVVGSESVVFLLKTEDRKYQFFCLGAQGEHKYQVKFDRLEDAVRRKVEHFLFEFFHRAAGSIYPLSFDLSDLADDLIVNAYKFKVNRSKYFNRMPKDFQTGSLMNFIKENNLLERFVDSHEQAYSSRAESTFFLTKMDDGRYRFFTVSGRWPCYFSFEAFFDRLEDAVRRKIDYFMLEVWHRATDEIYPFPFEMTEFVNDLIVDNIEKYRHKMPVNLKVSEIIEFIKANHLFERFVNVDDGFSNWEAVNLIRVPSGKYQFFVVRDRGMIEYKMEFDRVEDGVRTKIEFLLYALGHHAKDAIHRF